MKISNETKIGALTIIALVFLFLGFNFLKGKSLFKSGFYLYAKFPESKGLVGSNPVFINGFQAGTVSQVTASKDLKQILVEIKLNQVYDIPASSVADISSNPLGTSSLEITLGKSGQLLKTNDTIATTLTQGILGMVGSQIRPLADQAKITLQHTDTVMQNINDVMDSAMRAHVREITANLSQVTEELIQTTRSLNAALNLQSGALATTVTSMNSFTKNLADNNQKISNIMTNMQTTTGNLSKADINGMVDKLKISTDLLNATLTRMQSDNGTLGALINNKNLYDQLLSTTKSLQILLDDLRVHPKRYINISIFGRKDKGDYLTRPLVQDNLPSSIQK